MAEAAWYRGITPYQWRVLICAWLGWALDIMDGIEITIRATAQGFCYNFARETKGRLLPD